MGSGLNDTIRSGSVRARLGFENMFESLQSSALRRTMRASRIWKTDWLYDITFFDPPQRVSMGVVLCVKVFLALGLLHPSTTSQSNLLDSSSHRDFKLLQGDQQDCDGSNSRGVPEISSSWGFIRLLILRSVPGSWIIHTTRSSYLETVVLVPPSSNRHEP